MNGRRIIAVTLGVMLLAGLVWLGSRSPDRQRVPRATLATSLTTQPASTQSAIVTPQPVQPGQTDTTDTTEPAADERSEQSARRAALGFLELTEEAVHLSPDEGAAQQRSIATAAAADRLAAEVFDQLSTIAAEVPEGVAVEVAPIGVSSTPRGDGWDVSIWYVEVIVYGDQLAVEQWRTATYSLGWENDGWRMSALSSSLASSPASASSSWSSNWSLWSTTP